MTNILNKKIIFHNSAVTSLKNQTLLIEKVIKTMHKHVNLAENYFYVVIVVQLDAQHLAAEFLVDCD